MNAIEKLREFADAVECDGECRILHEHHGDFAGDCSERECNDCRLEYLRAIADEMQANMRDAEARLMPESVEWPRYEDGEPVRVGDEFMGKDGKTYTVHQVQFIGKCFSLHDFCDRKAQFNAFYGERVKRPAPKVLDADGVEIREGETVYVLGFGEPLTVKGFADDGRVLMSFHDEDSLGYKPSKLTHERPESWERLEEDAGKNPFDYCKDVGHRLDTCENAEAYKARDLVRRAKKLVGVER